MVAGKFGDQSPIVGALGHVHGLMIGGRLSRDSVDEPHGRGGVVDIGGGGEQVILEDGITVLSQGPKCEGDWAVAQLDVAHLAHDAICVRDGEVRETTVILFESVGAFCVWLS